MLCNLHFFPSKCRLFHNATLFGFRVTHILNTECAKIWKKIRRQKVKRGDFSLCDAPRLGRPKTVTTLEIIDQIHELISEDGRISAKSTAEQLGISRERVGSTFMKIWSCGSSPRSGSRNA